MSAYIVSEDHIEVLVSYFVRNLASSQLWIKVNGEYSYLTKENAKDVAYVLYRENVRSVNHRYNETIDDENFEFKFNSRAEELYGIGQIAGALDCLEYQSCENNDYFESEAWSIVCSMRKQLLHFVQRNELGDEITWEISEAKGTKVEA